MFAFKALKWHPLKALSLALFLFSALAYAAYTAYAGVNSTGPSFKPKGRGEVPIIRAASGLAPVKYIVDRIGGEFVNSIALLPAGSDPHTYEPKPSQLTVLENADVYFSIDTPFEVTWLPRFVSINTGMDIIYLADAALADDATFEKIKDSLKLVKYVPHPVIKKKKQSGEGHGGGHGEGGKEEGAHGEGAQGEAKEGAKHDQETSPEENSAQGEKASGHGEAHSAGGTREAGSAEKTQAEPAHADAANSTSEKEAAAAYLHTGHEGEDPHIWLSIKFLQRMSTVVCAKLSLIMPEQKLYFEKNLIALQSDLSDLDSYITNELKNLPENKKFFLVYHPAWGYFAKDYGLTQLAIEHEGKEVTPAMLGNTLEEAKAKGIQVVFVQKEFSPALAQNIAEQLGGGKVVALDPLGYNPINSIKALADDLAGKSKQ